MRIPRKVIIKGKEWKIRRVKDLKDERGDFASGLTSTDDRTIELEKRLPEYETEYVFWHEYFHALLFETGVSGNDGGLETLAEEIICDAFADFMTNEIEWKWKKKRK